MPDALNERTARLAESFEHALTQLEQAPPFAKPNHQPKVMDLTLRLLKQEQGVAALAGHAPRFEGSGIFAGSDWARPEHLQPNFVGASLAGTSALQAIEVLSELRFLALVRGQQLHPVVSPDDARDYLEQVLALNVDRLFPNPNEASRAQSPALVAGIQRLFLSIAEALGSTGILSSIVSEIDRILAQRPIRVERAIAMLQAVRRMADAEAEVDLDRRGRQLLAAQEGPTTTSAQYPEPQDYHAVIASWDAAALAAEATVLGDSMWATGLVCPQHAVLLHQVAERTPDHLASALGLGPLGRAALDLQQPLVIELIQCAIRPASAQAIYGLACLLTGGVLFLPPVLNGLRRLMEVPLIESVVEPLQHCWGSTDMDPRAALLAGTMQVLGQPLGVGQGDNPTCQSARAISLWSQVSTGYLLELLIQATVHGQIVMHLEGQAIHSRDEMASSARPLQADLDPVSTVLVPHLDAVYAAMSRLVVGRGEDGHKWINPEFHGWWNCRGFATTVDYATGAISGFDDFCRLFYACYHPAYRGPFPQAHPQPVGIAVTNSFGCFVGWHAVTIQRVSQAPSGAMRLYFFNPNNDSGQRWGPDLVTSTQGEGEYAGESSLAFDDFAARCYLFHYHEHEHGDPSRVPAETVTKIRAAVAASWGAEKAWLD